MDSKSFFLLLASALILEMVVAPPAPPPSPLSDGNVLFEEAPPPCLPSISKIKFKIQLVLFCLVMVAIAAFLLWMFSPGLRSLSSGWGRHVEIPRAVAPRIPSPRFMPTPTAPPIPSPPRVLSCPVCGGYPDCNLYVSCPYCGEISTLRVI